MVQTRSLLVIFGQMRRESGLANFSKLRPWEGSGTDFGELRHPKVGFKKPTLGAQGSEFGIWGLGLETRPGPGPG